MMYCHKCNRLLRDDNLVCTKCGFDNNTIKSHKLKETEIKESNKINPKTIFIGILLLFGLCILLSIIIFRKPDEEIQYSEAVTEKVSLTNELKYKELTINYPDTWGSSKTTIFYRDLPKINITFHEITEKEYNELIGLNDCLKHSFKEFEGLTYAEDNSYAYLFTLNSIYYKVIINYENNNSYNETVQNEISQIIDSIKQNKN